MLTSGWSRTRRLVAALAIAVSVTAAGCSAGHSPRPTPTRPATISSTGAGLPTGPTVVAPSPVSETGSARPPAFPAVVALSWLDGVSAEPALRMKARPLLWTGSDTDGLILWQGSTPGEQAELLPGGAYRWVGRDGSMVGCAVPPSRRLHCVGIDTAGNTAVTSQANGPRVVYRPDGRLSGEFRADGTPIAAVGSPTLARAIADSGVDMASLIDFATGGPFFAGGVTGDPHLITISGGRVTTQRVGDYWARSGDQAHQIQIRVESMPYQTDVSYVTVVGLGFPGHRVEFSLTGSLRIDGAVVQDRGRFHLTTLADGPDIGLWPPDANGVIDAMVLWPDGSTIFLSADSSLGLTVITHLPRGPASGLFGLVTTGQRDESVVPFVPKVADAPAGGPPGDFAGRSGAAVKAVSVDQVVDSWRVGVGESLFGQSAPAPQQSPVPAGQISPAATLSAENSCAAGDMTNRADVAACVFDVARTGDDGYVAQHVVLAAAASAPVVPTSLVTDWPALTLGTALLPQTLDPGAQVDTSVAAGSRRVYRINVDSAAALLITAAACPGNVGVDEPARGTAALRVFDGAGHPVSARRSGCGQGKTGLLAPGTYYLVLAGPDSGAAATFKIRVGLV